MDTSLIVLASLVVIIAVIMYLMGFSLIIVGAVGGVIASGFWLLHVCKVGLRDRKYEFLAAFAWFVFSILCFAYA